eukprot:g12401.t1 g12401   contig6:1847431-1848194(+)
MAITSDNDSYDSCFEHDTEFEDPPGGNSDDSRPTEGDEAEVATVGTTALLIASKFEKIHPPELNDLVYICDRGYTEDEFLKMAELMLTALEYRLRIPTACVFVVHSC